MPLNYPLNYWFYLGPGHAGWLEEARLRAEKCECALVPNRDLRVLIGLCVPLHKLPAQTFCTGWPRTFPRIFD